MFDSFVKRDFCKRANACLLFTVMDHDLLISNDFAGEAYLALRDIAGVTTSRPSSLNALQPITLTLTQPKPAESKEVT